MSSPWDCLECLYAKKTGGNISCLGTFKETVSWDRSTSCTVGTMNRSIMSRYIGRIWFLNFSEALLICLAIFYLEINQYSIFWVECRWLAANINPPMIGQCSNASPCMLPHVGVIFANPPANRKQAFEVWEIYQTTATNRKQYVYYCPNSNIVGRRLPALTGGKI